MIKIQSKTMLLSELLLVLLSFATNFGMENECHVLSDSLYVPAQGKRLALNPDGTFTEKSMFFTFDDEFQINNQTPIKRKNDYIGNVIKQDNVFYIQTTKEYCSTSESYKKSSFSIPIYITQAQFEKVEKMQRGLNKGVIIAIDNHNNTYIINHLTTSVIEKKPEIELEKLPSQQPSQKTERKETLNQEEKEIDKIMKRNETDEQEKTEIDDFSIKSTSKKNQPAPYWTTNKKIALAIGMSLFAALLYFIHKHNSFPDLNALELFKNIPFVSAQS